MQAAVRIGEVMEHDQDDDDQLDYADEASEPPEFGCCLPPGECCMPGFHFPAECHTAADYERRGR